MSRIAKALAAFGVLSTIGLAGCENDDDVIDIETPDGEIEIEEDGDVEVNN